MKKIRFITHKGKQILLLDFSRLKVDEITPLVAEAKTLIASQPERSLVTLTDLTDTEVNSDSSKIFKELAAHNKPYVKAGAVLGIGGLKRVIFNAVVNLTGRNLTAFDEMEKAKDWLSTQ